MNESDWSCIRRHQDGDTEAMSELVNRYRQPLTAFIMSKTWAPLDVDDVFQDTWFKALGKLDQYRPDNFLGWLMRIARNLIIDRTRRQHPARSLDEEQTQGTLLETLTDPRQPDAQKHLEQSEFAMALQAAVSRLPDDQKEVFMLRVQGDVPFKTIAKAQGVSINTALARMQYALDKLRRELANYKDERIS